MIIKNEKEKNTLLAAGKRLREVLDKVSEHIVHGVSSKELDEIAYNMIKEGGDEPAFLNYKPFGALIPFPATLCVSVNDEIVHGIPKAERIIKEGDIVSIDCGLVRDGIYTDAACTKIVGKCDKRTEELVEATRKAIKYALVFIRDGATTGDIGNAVETVANEYGFTIPPELGGHGVGASQHEEPFIPNIGDPGEGDVLVDGQVIAIEPILIDTDNPEIKLGKDKFTYLTADKSKSAHFEHTILVTKHTPIIVTGPMW